jgi:hypothetical protein
MLCYVDSVRFTPLGHFRPSTTSSAPSHRTTTTRLPPRSPHRLTSFRNPPRHSSAYQHLPPHPCRAADHSTTGTATNTTKHCEFIYGIKLITSTYDHRTLRTELPVRSAELKQCTGGLVVRWVTTGEYPLLYVFGFFLRKCTTGPTRQDPPT